MSQAQSALNHGTPQNRKQRRLAKRQVRRGLKAKSPGALLGAADSHHRAGDLAAAEALYRRVLNESPDELVALSQLGALCAQTQRYAEALPLLERALTIDPEHGPTLMNLGVIHAAEGRGEAADACFRKGAAAEPNDPETQKNYGTWCHRRGRLEDAAEALERGLAVAPQDRARQCLLGQIYGQLGQRDRGRQRFEQALALFPEDAELHAHLGALLATGGETQAALPHLARGFSHMVQSRQYKALFVEALGSAQTESYDAALEAALMACLEDGEIEAQRLSAALGSSLWLKYVRGATVQGGQADKGPTIQMDGVLIDPALIRLLEELVNVNLGLEVLLVPLRRLLLFKMRDKAAEHPEIRRFIAAFAMQCHANSYIFQTSEEELNEVGRLKAALEERIGDGFRPDAEFESNAALFALYQPLHRLAGFEHLSNRPLDAWSAPMRPLIQRTLLDPATEQALKSSIEPFGAIEDETSRAVRSQYEDNPYPRWISLPKTEPGSLQALIRAGSVDFALPEGIDENLQCLIAGCGTGRHPISVALVLRHAEITAVDLSFSSLAYAKRMAGLYGLDNLDFRHGDLLDLDSLGRRYRLIESMGVLHHMAEPERGLESLLGVLEPDGLLHLGLYSAPARRAVRRARERIQELGIEATPEAIRGFRRRIIVGEEPDLQDMASMSDFFDLDSFRDLVFHVQEHQFTIPEIESLLTRNGLTFLGFSGLKRSVQAAFNARFPAAEARCDLEAWHRFESDNPATFRGMYKFWCRRQS